VRTSRLSPATVLSALALFFALGGSAYAVGGSILDSQVQAGTESRCATGAVRGTAVVTAGAKVQSAFNCSGRRVSVQRVAAGTFDVRFPGNPAPRAVATELGSCEGPATLDLLAPGHFRIYTRGCATAGNVLQLVDLSFVLVAV
jgi:hypothetical protein